MFVGLYSGEPSFSTTIVCQNGVVDPPAAAPAAQPVAPSAPVAAGAPKASASPSIHDLISLTVTFVGAVAAASFLLN